MNKKINQKKISLIEYYNLSNMDLLVSNSPINRLKHNKKLANDVDKSTQLQKLKKMISSIKNCEA